MEIEALAAALEASAPGEWARRSAVGYPAANLVHLLGLTLLIGGIGVLDLRLMGLFPRLPAGALARALVPLAASGVLLLALSGLVMLAAEAQALVRSAIFRWKLVLIAIALVNVAVVHVLHRRRFTAWDDAPPPAARLTAAISLGAWLAVAALGRLIAYV